MCLQAHHEDIVTDKDEECQQSFVMLLKELVNSKVKARNNLFEAITDHNKQNSIHEIVSVKSNQNHLTRGLYCDLMVALYNDSENFREVAEIALIKNIADPNEIIQSKLLIFWSDPSRMPLNPSQRLLSMMKYKNIFEDEQTWLKATVWLLIDISRH